MVETQIYPQPWLSSSDLFGQAHKAPSHQPSHPPQYLLQDSRNTSSIFQHYSGSFRRSPSRWSRASWHQKSWAKTISIGLHPVTLALHLYSNFVPPALGIALGLQSVPSVSCMLASIPDSCTLLQALLWERFFLSPTRIPLLQESFLLLLPNIRPVPFSRLLLLARFLSPLPPLLAVPLLLSLAPPSLPWPAFFCRGPA